MPEKETESSLHIKPKILVVDDEKRVRDTCHKMLAADGFDVSRAESGDVGIQMIEKDHFDIILLDLMMPGLSGLETLARVRDMHPDTVVIVITGYATVEHSIEAMKRGAFDFLSKPFSPQDLRLVIGKAVGFIETLQDITTENSRMRVLINHLGDGVMACDAQKRVALANPPFLKMVGYRGEDVVGRPVTELIKTEKLLGMIDQALSMPPEAFVELTDEIEPENGGNPDVILGVRCVPFRDRLGRNVGAITVLHDITVLKKMNQAKSDFVSMVAHEIQSPMNTVLMQLKNITGGIAGPVSEKQREILERMSLRIKTLSDLSADLLDLAKIESGLITLEKEKLDAAALLKDQMKFHQVRCKEKNIDLELIPLPDLPHFMANRTNMEEVLSNLITNAIRYTPEGGHIRISAEAEGNSLCIRVSDTGIGLDPEDLKRIFVRFYRVKNEKTRSIPGTGLGLSIVKRIVAAHNGVIDVASDPGHGSTFTVYLPLSMS
jgi:two-component system, OmpR family, phosphate regulon sensor histidine kinase PhoR